MHQTALDQHLGDLDRVGGGTLAQVVGDDEHRQAVRVRRVTPQPADEDLEPLATSPESALDVTKE